MTTPAIRALSRAQRRRRLTLALLRSSASTAVLVAAYYLCPLDRLTDVPIGISLAVGLLALATVAGFQVRSIIRARHPGIRAVEALSTTAPLILLLGRPAGPRQQPAGGTGGVHRHGGRLVVAPGFTQSE